MKLLRIVERPLISTLCGVKLADHVLSTELSVGVYGFEPHRSGLSCSKAG